MFHVEHSALQSQVGGAEFFKTGGEERVGQTFSHLRVTFLKKYLHFRSGFYYIHW